MIRIAVDFASPAGGQEHLNSPAVFAAGIVQVGNVVISLVAQEGHAVSLAQISRLLITIQRPGEIIQADEAHRHVVEAKSDSFPLPMFGKCLVGPFVVPEGFHKAVLAMKDVAHVVFQARNSQGFPKIPEGLPRLVGCLKCALVFAKQNQRLDRAALRASCLQSLP